MAISNTDIGFFNSGSNSSNLGLGGQISSIKLGERLFEDLTADQSLYGLTDYKCIYIKNLNDTDYFFNFSINISNKNYSQVSFGLPFINRCSLPNCGSIFTFNKEEHVLTFRYLKNISGQFNLLYNSNSFLVVWNGNIDFIKSQIVNGLSFLGDSLTINVEKNTCISDMCDLILSIKYSRPKNYELLTISDVNIGIGPNFNFSTFKRNSGGPIGVVASSIENSQIIPKNDDGSDISFFSNLEKIVFDKLGPGEFFPMWIKRSTPAAIRSTGGISSDSFSINISASNTSVIPTPTPSASLITVLDQSQTIMNDKVSVNPNSVYWQTFTAGYTGTLSNLELGFFNTSNDAFLVGQSFLRIFSGNGLSNSNLINSSSINVNIAAGLVYNSYPINIPITKDRVYTIAYYPGFYHYLAINNDNNYLNGNFSIDNNSYSNKDMLFKTYALISSITTPTPTPTPTRTPVVPI